MNIIELQDNLKDLPDSALMQEMQMPTGSMPQFLVLSELKRRKRMRDEYQRQQAANMPTVAEEVMTSAGAPQGGLTSIARNMAPNSSIAQNTGESQAVPVQPTRAPQMMADGGVLSLFRGGRTKEDLYRQVEPFPENGTAAERRNWTLTYGMTHNLDGTPKMMSPDVATTDVSPFQQGLPYAFKNRSPFISDVSADIGDFMPTVPGAAQDPSTDLDVSGILAGTQQFDFDRPFAQQDATNGLPVAAPDFDATDENDILDAEEARLVQQEVLDANRGDQPPPDISQIDPETNLDISAALGIGSLGQNLADAINNQETLPNISTGNMDEREAEIRSAFGPFITEQEITELANASFPNDPDIVPYNEKRTDVETPLIPKPDRSIDRQINPEKYMDLDDFLAQDSMRDRSSDRGSSLKYPTFLPYPTASGSFGNDAELAMGYGLEDSRRGRNIPRTERTSDTSDSFYPELPVPASDVKPPMPLLENVLDQGRSIPEMPIDPSSVMPPMMGDTGDEETAAPSMPTGTDSYGALESRIAKMLADREKSAESDKWLALAQAGMALMSSDSPTLGGALGEAGLVGIGQLRDARSQYDKDVLELLSTQSDIDSARADRNLQLQELALERDELEQTREASEALSKYRMASLDPRNASISDLQAGLNYINGEIQTQATTVTYDEVSGEEIEKIDMTKVDPQLLIQKKSLEDSLLTRLRGTSADFDATGS